MRATTLVTGAAGFAGGHLLDLLVGERAGDENVIVGWHRPGGKSAPRQGVEWQSVDILDRHAVRAAIDRLRPAVVYHCAGAAHVGHAWDKTEATFAINVRGTHNLLDALERMSRVARAGSGDETTVVIPSSALVYAPADHASRETDPIAPDGPYGVSKLAQEMLASHAGAGLKVIVARAFNHFGPRQDPFFAASGWARRLADIERGRWPEATIAVGNLEARRDLTDVRDTVRAYRLMAAQGRHGDVFNVCSGTAIPIRELLDRLIARARVAVTVTVDPARMRPSDTPVLLGDPARIQAALGWRAEIPLDRTLDDLLDYWRTRD